MPSNFPGGLDSFTTKVDGIDDIMADHVNDLQNAIVAMETPLVQILAGGWIPDNDTWVYVSASSFKIVGKNVTARFPVGTKLKLTQTTVKYFYVVACAMSGSDTLVTITAGSDYSLANAAITAPSYAYGIASGHPDWFGWTPTYSAAANMTYTSVTTNAARFRLIGKQFIFFIDCIGETGGTESNAIIMTLPTNILPVWFASCGGWIIRSGPIEAGVMYVRNTGVAEARPSGGNWVIGLGKRVSIFGSVEIS